MDKEKIEEILELHRKWLRNERDGVRLVCESSADLRSAEGYGPQNGGVKYEIGKTVEVKSYESDELQHCASGLNLCTLGWACQEYLSGRRKERKPMKNVLFQKITSAPAVMDEEGEKVNPHFLVTEEINGFAIFFCGSNGYEIRDFIKYGRDAAIEKCFELANNYKGVK